MSEYTMRKIYRYIIMFILLLIGLIYISENKFTNMELLGLIFYIMACFLFMDVYIPTVCIIENKNIK